MLVAEELGRADHLAQLEPDPLLGLLAGALPARPRLGALARHRRIEARDVHGHAAGAQRILGQIERETISVVELERGLAGQLAAGREVRGRLLQQAQAALQGAPKAGLLELAAPR